MSLARQRGGILTSGTTTSEGANKNKRKNRTTGIIS